MFKVLTTGNGEKKVLVNFNHVIEVYQKDDGKESKSLIRYADCYSDTRLTVKEGIDEIMLILLEHNKDNG